MGERTQTRLGLLVALAVTALAAGCGIREHNYHPIIGTDPPADPGNPDPGGGTGGSPGSAGGSGGNPSTGTGGSSSQGGSRAGGSGGRGGSGGAGSGAGGSGGGTSTDARTSPPDMTAAPPGSINIAGIADSPRRFDIRARSRGIRRMHSGARGIYVPKRNPIVLASGSIAPHY